MGVCVCVEAVVTPAVGRRSDCMRAFRAAADSPLRLLLRGIRAAENREMHAVGGWLPRKEMIKDVQQGEGGPPRGAPPARQP
ncbi:hypothetical protein cyc_01164 [Cyclospora cayetanensis]|uniref:Uncharacterized protein n=1 Tax=Cyclospora cayetanensis TaxID=88456 RepID=A0A1D3D2Y8_9EIME|nr:hypothetical protein cyc_01164 [Cyclospora cayetanensis]